MDGKIQSREGLLLTDGYVPATCVVTDTICLGAGDERKLGPGCRVTTRPPGIGVGIECDKQQRGATLTGVTTAMAYVCRSCPCNAHNALCNRHGVAPPEVDVDLKEAHHFFTNIQFQAKMLFAEHRVEWQTGWLAKWPEKKRNDILLSEQWDSILPSKLDAMVKREVAHNLPKKARLIQYYRNLATQAAYGPEFYALQKTYTQLFQRREVFPGVRVTLGSGLNADALGEWMRLCVEENANPHFYERDGKNWDSTMQWEHLRLRLNAYAPAGPDFCEFVRAGYKAQGRDPRGALRYKLRGTVKSGHNDTTLGNSLVNAMISATAMLRCGLTGDIIVAGDDLLTVVSGDFDEHALAQAERAMGISPEYRKFLSVNDVSFISGVWFQVGSEYFFTPKPGRLLARLFWTTHPPPPKRMQEYRNGIVAGLRPTCGDMPVIGAFLEAHFDAGIAVGLIDQWKHRDYLVASPRVLDKASYMQAFTHRYGLDTAEVASVEEMINATRGVPGFIKHPVLDKIMAVDLADIDVRPVCGDY